MLNDVRESEGNRREWIVEVLKDIDGMHTGYLHKGELVRCKECKWYKQSEAFCENGNGLWQAGDECFCSYGERSEQ